MSEPVLTTRRLVIREFADRDLDPYAAMLGDPETMRYYPRPYSREEARGFMERNAARYLANGFGVWVLEDRESGVFVGDCGLAVSLVEGIAEVEIMWHVVRERWRQGLATEAATAVRDHAFGDLGLRRLIALVRPINSPSRGVAEKLGMEIERDAIYADLPHLIYAQAPAFG
ncbi:MAG TPA: GNAT family N-acetyltransferase [Actinomycetota bacterium]|nr:GNAT family N-acetyltransferase [Actinomycetota bacterium]